MTKTKNIILWLSILILTLTAILCIPIGQPQLTKADTVEQSKPTDPWETDERIPKIEDLQKIFEVPKEVAETMDHKDDLTDGTMQMVNGGRIKTNINDINHAELVFGLQLKDPVINDFYTYAPSKVPYINLFWVDSQSSINFIFTLSKFTDGKYYPITTQAFDINYNGTDNLHVTKSLERRYDIEDNTQMRVGGVFQFATSTASKIEDFDLTETLIKISDLNALTSYYVTMSYAIHVDNGSNPFGVHDVRITHSATLSTSFRSVYYCAKTLDKINPFGENSPYRDLIDNGVTQSVKITYLEGIEGTPFARRVTAQCDVGIDDDGIVLHTVEEALGFELNCGNSQAYTFIPRGNDEYLAYYLKSVAVKTRTVDGNSMVMYLDINESFQEFMQPYLDKRVIDSDCKEFFFSYLLEKYPQLDNMAYEDLHGFFGIAMIPQGNTLGELWNTIFGETSKMGLTQVMSYDIVLDYQNFQTLRDDYGYAYLNSLFSFAFNQSGLIGSEAPHASCYVFYTDGAEKFALVGEDGGDFDEGDQPIKDVGNTLGDLWNNLTSDHTIFITIAVIVGVVILVQIIKKR
ncbi:MAG: hypothetical protein E7369_02765 [Clostridiales bacterium]|nr:hypothetical protein [Clostridiales bacterium]